MTWIPGTGELSNRLARALGVKGRISTEIDEIVIGHVLLSDAPNLPPYRTDGRLCFATTQTLTGAVGFPPQGGVLNGATVPQLLVGVWFSVAVTTSVRLILAQGPVAGEVGTSILRTTEAIGAGLSEATPISLRGYQGIAQPGGVILWQQALLGNDPLYVRLNMVLQPDAQLFVSSNALAGTMDVSAEALFFLR